MPPKSNRAKPAARMAHEARLRPKFHWSGAGAKKSKLPDFVRPQLATLVDEVPGGEEWLHEVKLDGYRALCRVVDGGARFFTREGLDWTSRFGSLADGAADLPIGRALLDGEVVVVKKDGSTAFQSLQEALSRKETGRLTYYVFDLLYAGEYDLTNVPLLERKRLLAEIVPPNSARSPFRYSDHVIGQAQAFFRRACAMGLEGIVSKRKDAHYRSGRSRGWLKIKCHASQELVIGGFTDPAGSRAGLGALLLGAYDDKGQLIYAGRVGTGFNHEMLSGLRARLEPIRTASPPFANPPVRSFRQAIHWVEPKYSAEIEFTAWTRDGLLRHPSFKGLREDKSTGAIKREKAMPTRSTISRLEKPTIAGVTLSNPDRVLYPEQGITKLELAEFYRDIAGWIMPHVSGRLLTLVRCPEGHRKCFYQKHIGEDLPDSFRRVRIEEKSGSSLYVMIDSLPGLITLVQMGVLEIHTWGSLGKRPEYPDRLTFDLDPDPAVAWEAVVAAARQLRQRLSDLGLNSFVKTTGGKGLHVVVPIAPREQWDEVKQFSKSIAEGIARAAPERYLTTMSKAKRKGKIFIDYLRNSRGATAVAAYSTRAKPGAPVSAPIRWEELSSGVRSDQFTVRNLRERLSRIRKDPWADYESARRAITMQMKKRLLG